ncbi:CPBP family intramembrane glutamic endopeptidase [Marilutibacter alkalisoli]|uniref:CPBP family intramembrane glutamic endopeptidase n=1 Tax=Marilutibacter alkalisoli TaxID=2591633 RepID=UPI00141F2392|nr:CPBP family intramembrane glutamic endopeptidase [Lysobacter alkalisoli]
MHIATYSLTFAVMALLLALAAMPFDRRIGVATAALFALYLGLDDLDTALPTAVAAADLLGGRWNWSGKVYSLLLAAVVIWIFRLRPDAVGLTFRQRNLRASMIALVLLVALGAALGFAFDPDTPSFETLAFQATMPALAEELAYRGVAPALLLGLIGRKAPPGQVPWAVVVVTAVMFSLWHGLGYGRDGFSFEPVSASFTLVGGLAYGWMRFNSGSLLFPLLAHALGNLVFQLTAFV